MADSPATLPVAFWLVPSEPWRSSFGALIAALGAAHRGPAFEPHITIEVSRVRGDDPGLDALLDRVAASVEPMTLTAGRTVHSEAHFKTLFIEFDDPRPFALQRQLRAELGEPPDYVLHPHLSLLYHGGLAPGTRERLAAAHRFDGERIGFDTLAVVRAQSAAGDLSDIEALDTSLRRTLGSVRPARG
ncbi:MAG: 2'-5' RNA ligase family protein [Burkholderiaceae bacterium]|nr:2'-5' RNA ligase family protein [Burkholderiaceae bacterium]